MKIRVRYILRCLFFYLAESTLFKRKKNTANKELLIVHTDAIGDYILFRNFIAAFKHSDRFKGYSITLCANQAYRDLALHFDTNNVDTFIWIDRKRFDTGYTYRREVFEQVNRKQYDVVINPSYSHDFIFADSIVRQAQSNNKIGQVSDAANTYKFLLNLSHKWYTSLLDIGRDVQFEFDRNKHFCEAVIGTKLSMLNPALEVEHNLNKQSYLLLFPGAGEAQKRWPVEHFARCADYVKVTYGMDAIVVGAAYEKALGESIQSLATQSVISNQCGASSLVELVHLVNGARLLLSNDSSAVHIAACTKTATICVGNGRHYGRFTPYPDSFDSNLRFVFPAKVSQMAKEDLSGLKEQTAKYPIAFIGDITVNQVLREIDDILKNENPAAR